MDEPEGEAGETASAGAEEPPRHSEVGGSLEERPPPRPREGSILSRSAIPTNDAEPPASRPSRDKPTPPGGKSKFSVSEDTPRWRFVHLAKKTEGYSSVFAGIAVQGLTAEEVVKSFKIPKGKEDDHIATKTTATRDQVQIGKLNAEWRAEEEGRTRNLAEVGKLDVGREEDEFEETFDGSFGGWGKRYATNGEEEPFEAEEKEGGKEGEEEESSIDKLATADGETLVNPVLAQNDDSLVELAVEAVEDLPLETDGVEVGVDDDLETTKNVDAALTKDGNEFDPGIEFNPIATRSISPTQLSGEPKPEEDDGARGSHRRKTRILSIVMLFLLCIFLGLLGVIIDNPREDKENANGAANVRGGAGAPTPVSETNEPSSAPSISSLPSAPPSGAPSAFVSLAPTPERFCPPKTKRFVLTLQLGQHPTRIAWSIYDACTGKFFHKCSAGARGCYTAAPPGRAVRHVGCLPSEYYGTGAGIGYVLQVSNMVGSPDFSYAMRYDGELVLDADVGDTTSLQLNQFGEVGVRCSEVVGFMPMPSTHPTASNLPSAAPTTSLPSIQPSSMPTASGMPSVSSRPSRHPSASSRPSWAVQLRNVVHPPNNHVVPCRESVEADLAGRIVGLDGAFCGFCYWKNAGFFCYQRVDFLRTRYQMTRVGARQGLLNQGHCKVPESWEENEQIVRWVEQAPYCGNVETVQVVTIGRAKDDLSP